MKYNLTFLILGALAATSQGFSLHPEHADGIFFGSLDDENGMNHTRVGDASDAGKMLRSVKFASRDNAGSSIAKRTTQHIDCHGPVFTEDFVDSLRKNLGNTCDEYGDTKWVKPRHVVYALKANVVAYFCNYDHNDPLTCDSADTNSAGRALDKQCKGIGGEVYYTMDTGVKDKWSYGIAPKPDTFCQAQGGKLAQQD